MWNAIYPLKGSWETNILTGINVHTILPSQQKAGSTKECQMYAIKINTLCVHVCAVYSFFPHLAIDYGHLSMCTLRKGKYPKY